MASVDDAIDWAIEQGGNLASSNSSSGGGSAVGGLLDKILGISGDDILGIGGTAAGLEFVC